MKWIPEMTIGWYNAWLLPVLYGIISMGILFFLPKERRKRILTFPKFKSKIEKIAIGMSSFIFGRILCLYSLFIPLQLWTRTFYIGISLYLVGMISSVYAMWSFAKADLSKPVTGGIYKITRHPMQIMSLIMWIGIGITAENWIIIAGTVLLGIMYYPSFQAQERFCREKYGEAYITYMKKTPRYLLIK
jgi:protein-S-isoprenylcysteine O-methyltransferase Ste14